MFKFFRRTWRYFTASAESKFQERADPKIQLEQAITEAQDQHRRLTEQAANVIANQKQTEMRLSRAMDDLGKANASTRQALLMVDEAQRRGDTGKVTQYNQAAEGFANRLISIEKQVEDLKTMHLQTTQAANQGKSAVSQNPAMATLSLTVGQDVPSFDQVRDKIEQRYAKALGSADLQGQTVESQMLEVEQAALNTEAESRLSELRSQLGLTAPPTAEIGAGDQQALAAGGADSVPA